MVSLEERLDGPAETRDEFSSSVIVSIDRQGSMSIRLEDSGQRLDDAASRKYLVSLLREDPATRILIDADPVASAGAIVRTMSWLAENGAEFPGAGIVSIESVP
jgi:biopolymer transport protein ExbD